MKGNDFKAQRGSEEKTHQRFNRRAFTRGHPCRGDSEETKNDGTQSVDEIEQHEYALSAVNAVAGYEIYPVDSICFITGFVTE